MKSFLKIGLVVLSILSASIVQANDMELLVRVAKENSKWVSFIASDIKEVDLTLYDSSQEVVYEQHISAVGNKFQTYDLSALPVGYYTLTMESSNKLITYKIEINASNAILSKPLVLEIKRPVFVKENDMISLDLNGACAGEVEIIIYNEYNEKVHEDVYSDLSKVIKKFDVSKTIYKELTFVIRSGGQEFSETVKL